MEYSYKFRIYPTPSQENSIQRTFGCCRFVFNHFLAGPDYPVSAYRLGDSTDLEALLEFVPDSNGKQRRLKGLMQKSSLSLAEAKAAYPDWYERRIERGESRGRWTIKRDLYDWWLHRIRDEIKVGHRYYGIMTLAIYAKKCGIDEDELRRDAFSFLDSYDAMSVDDTNRFTMDDIVCALEMYNENYVTFPRDDIAKLSGMTMPINRRKYLKQNQHLYLARRRKEDMKMLGITMKGKEGRPIGSGTAEKTVMEWRQEHPEGTKKECRDSTAIRRFGNSGMFRHRGRSESDFLTYLTI